MLIICLRLLLLESQQNKAVCPPCHLTDVLEIRRKQLCKVHSKPQSKQSNATFGMLILHPLTGTSPRSTICS